MFSQLSRLCGLFILAPIHLVAGYGYNESGTGTDNSLGVDGFAGGYEQWNTTVYPLTATGWVAGDSNGYGSFDQWSSGVSCNFGYGTYTGNTCLTYAVQNATFVAANNSDLLSSHYMNQATMVLVQNANAASKTQSFAAYYVVNDAGQTPSCNLTSENAYSLCNKGHYNLGTIQTISANPSFASDLYTFPANTGIKVTCKSTCSQTGILKPNWHNLLAGLVPFMDTWYSFAARFAVTRPGGKVISRCRVTFADTAKYPLDSCPDWIPAMSESLVYDDTVPVDALSGQPDKRGLSSPVTGRRGLSMST